MPNSKKAGVNALLALQFEMDEEFSLDCGIGRIDGGH